MTRDGPVNSYRDRSENEVRDISVVRHVGERWSKRVTISDDSWQIAACPVNGPAVAAESAHVIVAGYAAPESQSRIKEQIATMLRGALPNSLERPAEKTAWQAK
jgi:hypothetical protein